MGMGEGLTPRIAELLGTGQRSLHSNQCIWIKSGKHSHPQGISGNLSDHVSIFSRSTFPLSVPTWCNAYNFFTCDRLERTKSSHQTLDLPKFTRKLIIRLLMTTWCTISQRSKTNVPPALDVSGSMDDLGMWGAIAHLVGTERRSWARDSPRVLQWLKRKLILDI